MGILSGLGKGAFRGIAKGYLDRRKELVDSRAEEEAAIRKEIRLDELNFKGWDRKREVTLADTESDRKATVARRQASYIGAGMKPEDAKKASTMTPSELANTNELVQNNKQFELNTAAVNKLLESPGYASLDDGTKEAFRAAYMKDPVAARNYQIVKGDDGRHTIISEALYIARMKLDIAKMRGATTNAQRADYKAKAQTGAHNAGAQKILNVLKASGVTGFEFKLDITGKMAMTTGKGPDGAAGQGYLQAIRTIVMSQADPDNPLGVDELYSKAILENPFDEFRRMPPDMQAGMVKVTPDQQKYIPAAGLQGLRDMLANPATIDHDRALRMGTGVNKYGTAAEKKALQPLLLQLDALQKAANPQQPAPEATPQPAFVSSADRDSQRRNAAREQ